MNQEHEDINEEKGSMKQNQAIKYLKFFAMIFTSMVAMYVFMYLNTDRLGHIRWSETRFYMTLIMGASMAVIMLTFMLDMYKNRIINTAIYVMSGVVFVVALFLVRSQTTVQDQSWMRAMIPHHSIAILTSDNAQIRDVRVRELANQIILAQEREIEEMNWLLQDIRENGIAETVEQANERPVPDFEQSLEDD